MRRPWPADTLISPLRADVNGVLEQARADKRIGKALEAHAALSAPATRRLPRPSRP